MSPNLQNKETNKTTHCLCHQEYNIPTENTFNFIELCAVPTTSELLRIFLKTTTLEGYQQTRVYTEYNKKDDEVSRNLRSKWRKWGSLVNTNFHIFKRLLCERVKNQSLFKWG